LQEAEPKSLREIAALRMSFGALVVLLSAVALIAFLLGVMEHQSCTNLRVEVTKPEPGTPRYGWCNGYDDLYPWVLTLVPTMSAALFAVLVRRRNLPTLVLAVVVLMGAFVVDSHPGRLDYVHTLTLLPGVLG
jgi:hypothetical protein